MRAADTFACLALEKIRICIAEYQLACVQVDWVNTLFGEMIYRLVNEGKVDILNNLG